MRKLPNNAVSNNILIAETEQITYPVSCLVRLKQATLLDNITEVSVPTKFMFIYFGPKINCSEADKAKCSYVHIGRAMATLMADSVSFKHEGKLKLNLIISTAIPIGCFENG